MNIYINIILINLISAYAYVCRIYIYIHIYIIISIEVRKGIEWYQIEDQGDGN